MLQFSQERIKAMEQAINWDRLFLHRRVIAETAQRASPGLHQRTQTSSKQQLLAQMIDDAARENYQAEELPLLYNCVIWIDRPFYRESPFNHLFNNRLLGTKERVQQLFAMLKLQNGKQLPQTDFYADRFPEPISQILSRIVKEYHQAEYQKSDVEEHGQLIKLLIRIELQSLLTTLLKEILGNHQHHWQGLDPHEHDEYINIENADLRRQLTLKASADSELRIEGKKDDLGQHLQLQLPRPLNETHIELTCRYLYAYLMDLVSAQELAKQRKSELLKEESNA